jgi:hypothetical protein
VNKPGCLLAGRMEDRPAEREVYQDADRRPALPAQRHTVDGGI